MFATGDKDSVAAVGPRPGGDGPIPRCVRRKGTTSLPCLYQPRTRPMGSGGYHHVRVSENNLPNFGEDFRPSLQRYRTSPGGQIWFVLTANEEQSLYETKDVVRKKLGLGYDTPIELAQLRDGRRIDLEDGMFLQWSFTEISICCRR